MFTAKVQYALILLQELYSCKVRGSVGPVKLQDVAEKHGLKPEFLEQVAGYLRKRNVLSSIKGPGGGYILGDKKHTFKDIYECVHPESELKLVASGEQAKDYIRELYQEYLTLMGEMEI